MEPLRVDDLITDEVRTVGISGHISPDGDCVGSCLGLYHYLKKNHPQARADIFLEFVPEELKILPGAEAIRTAFTSDVETYDVFFILDSEKARTAGAEAMFDRARLRVNIDHHVSNPGSGEINYIVPDASSVCELMTDVLDFDRMDVSCAMALYTGIVTDTGLFRYSATSPKTMRVAARLLEFPFDFSALIEHVELERTFSQNRTLGMMLADSRLELDGRCIVCTLDHARMQKEKISHADTDPVVSQMNLTTGIECALFAYEPEEGTVKVSLRSKKTVDVSEIAKAFGGGGHIRAAGCTTKGRATEIIAQMLPYVEAQLKNG